MQLMTPPPTPGRAGDKKISRSTRSEKQKHGRTEKQRRKSNEKHRRRAEKNEQRERESANSPGIEEDDAEPITRNLSSPPEDDLRAKFNSHSAERHQTANRAADERRRGLDLSGNTSHDINSTSAVPKHGAFSGSHDHKLDWTSSLQHNHKHSKKRQHSSRDTPTPVEPCTSRQHSFHPTSSLKHKRSKKHHHSSRTTPTPFPNPTDRSRVLPQQANPVLVGSETYLESKLDQLLNNHFSLPFPTLNPLETLLTLPTYQPPLSNPTLSAAYTFVGAMQAEQLNLYDRSADLECQIKNIRATPWKLSTAQHREISRLEEMGGLCEGFALELMIEQGGVQGPI